MPSSPSNEPTKTTKRKGTRSVSTLTPTQLARKRANDREAQRAIRARTKEHIEKLERELEELKSGGAQSRDDVVNNLLKKNRALEKEIQFLSDKLREVGAGMPPTTSQHYPPPENMAGAPSSGVSSRASSFGQNSGDFSNGVSYIPTSEPREPWSAVLPVSVPSTVSSPSSTGNDEYRYIPTTVGPLLDTSCMPTSMPFVKGHDSEFDDIDSDSGYAPGLPSTMPGHYVAQQSWPMYPVYYPQSPAL
ncbi:uncharacterized protein E0L32_007080 [Thyridium curvatum]|uniref:BZIP transcription factor n=1 Tax=Thyridium curvatum TaxID=1093900 RepID=A0A507B0F7_9PEZI|nr:uncharacterized protein E0L32_007080 [Thyridium curvatum]TPX12194.1 hypothetical protein E0L32_007080 [Thyridium curvatum]